MDLFKHVLKLILESVGLYDKLLQDEDNHLINNLINNFPKISSIHGDIDINDIEKTF